MKTLPSVPKMTPDTRKPSPRADEIAYIARALALGALPLSKDNDGERAECDKEMVYYAVYDCHYNDVVARAVAAATRLGGWAGPLMVEAALEREAFNKLRASNAKRYGA